MSLVGWSAGMPSKSQSVVFASVQTPDDMIALIQTTLPDSDFAQIVVCLTQLLQYFNIVSTYYCNSVSAGMVYFIEMGFPECAKTYFHAFNFSSDSFPSAVASRT